MFAFNHFNFNVTDLERSIAFYHDALGLEPVRRKEAADGSFILTFLGDGKTEFQLELTWLRDHPQKYDLGECEFHLALAVEDMERPTLSTKSWAASATRIRLWVFTLSLIPTVTGSRSFLPSEEHAMTNCEDCVYYEYDPEADTNYCEADLDEDEMERFLRSANDSCPFYRPGDEYRTARRQ